MASDGRQQEAAHVDLIVATVARDRELSEFLVSVREQLPVSTRVIVVDQNDDDRVGLVIRQQQEPPELVHVRAERGASRARNTGLELATAPIVAWPDDDCTYPSGLLSYVLGEFAADPALDVLVGRIEDPSGRAGQLAMPANRQILDSKSVWRYPSAPTFFARRAAAARVGNWSTDFGPGGSTRWDTGEDTDWLIRAVRAGLCVRFDPLVKVMHRDVFLTASKEARQRARRYGRCTSAVALTHGYGLRFVAWLVIRAAGGFAVSLAMGRFARARIHLQAMLGRVEGAVRFKHPARHGGEAEARVDASRGARPRR